METTGDKSMDVPPNFGLKLSLNNEYPIPTKQVVSTTTKQALEFIPLSLRYMKYYASKKMANKKPFMDFLNVVSSQRMYGCPLGGIGGGTIGRGYKGEFCRFQLYPGIYEYVTVPECQFIINIKNGDNETLFQSVLSTYKKPKKAPPSWEWNLNGDDCEYTGLYPRSWTTYNLEKYGIKLVCRQISPVIPNNYKDSSLPCAVFVWSAVNVSDEHRDVSITFTWTEILPGKKKDSKIDIERYSEESTCGVSLEQTIRDTPCTFTIAKLIEDNETIHEGYCTFNAANESNYVWDCLKNNGKLEPIDNNANKGKKESSSAKKMFKCDSMGLSSVMSLEPGSNGETEFCLAWDMPKIRYKKDGKTNKRFYTRYFGSDGIAGASIASYAIKHYKRWEKQIAEFQEPILCNCNIPDWLKGALMNELYYVADGGTIWFDVQDEYPETDPRHYFGVFGYLEGHEYRMYNTYDVHFYASFALAQLWPNLQVVLQYTYRDTIPLETKQCRKSLYNGKSTKYKIKDSMPHDLGDPEGEPFTRINCYNVHDVSEWRDLNLKFILQVVRDYRILKCHSAPFSSDRYKSLQFIDDVRDGTENELYVRCTSQEVKVDKVAEVTPEKTIVQHDLSPVGNILEMLYRNDELEDPPSDHEDEKQPKVSSWDATNYIVDMYDSCVNLLRKSLSWDQDGDGLIENSGWPDQTFDAWVMTGPSAYCGSLWLAAIKGLRQLALHLNKKEDEEEFSKLLDKAKASFEEKLWNGCSHYRFDSKPCNERVVMSDQLAGLWYLHASGIPDGVFPEANVQKALRTVYENNVLKFCNGKMGAVNGYVLGDKGKIGKIDTTAIQSMEMWTGVTYGLAALMIYEGMHEEAFVTAGGMYNRLIQSGLAFETPEALYENGNHRAVGYMRPLSVWAMYQAITASPPPRLAQSNGHAHQTKDS